jgi:hypothetical protein
MRLRDRAVLKDLKHKYCKELTQISPMPETIGGFFCFYMKRLRTTQSINVDSKNRIRNIDDHFCFGDFANTWPTYKPRAREFRIVSRFQYASAGHSERSCVPLRRGYWIACGITHKSIVGVRCECRCAADVNVGQRCVPLVNRQKHCAIAVGWIKALIFLEANPWVAF